MVVVDPKIVARTPRLLLRPLSIEDAADVLEMRRDVQVMKHTAILPSPDLSKTQAWIQGCFDSPINWNFAIELLPNALSSNPPSDPRPIPSSPPPVPQPRVIGLIGAVRAPEVGYMLHNSAWGKGYATEALLAFLPLFFAHFDEFEYAEAHTDDDHVGSHNVLQKAGFTVFERREKDFENPVLGWTSTIVWRMYRGDAGSRP